MDRSFVSFFAGNKADLLQCRQVSLEAAVEVTTMSRDNHMLGPIETSCKTANNVDKAFYLLAKVPVCIYFTPATKLSSCLVKVPK